MAYSTVEQVRALLSGNRNEQHNLTPNELDSDQIESQIANADAQIDASLIRRYDIPLVEPVPDLINHLSVDIASYLCDLVYRGAREYGTETHPFQLRYDRARRLLDDLGSGRRLLFEDTDDEGEVFNPYEGTLMTTQNIFTRWPEGVISDA